MKNQFLPFFLIIGESLMVLCSKHEGVATLYYVKPSQSNSQCPPPGLPCETFQYYLENIDTTLNQEKNVTMIFLTGNHTVNSVHAHPVLITVPVITMTGDCEDIISCRIEFEAELQHAVLFSHNTMVVFKNLQLIEWTIGVMPSTQATQFRMSSVVLQQCSTFFSLDLIGLTLVESTVSKSSIVSFATHLMFTITSCTFHDSTLFVNDGIGDVDVGARDSTFINSPLSTQGGVVLSGATVFKDTNKESAILSYHGSITLSGTISFVNNSALRGGAMALYSSTLNIAPSANVTFINNTAEEVGGAIYIAPGVLSRVSKIYPPCFYQLLNCSGNTTYYFIFKGNSATNGGDDIYGMSLNDSSCSSQNDVSCHLITIERANPSNSSISSDPLHVCLCDSDGEPQCKNNSYTYSISPGETLTLSLVLVGIDFGLTTGKVYASIYQPKDSRSFTTTSLSPDYGQVVRHISTCTKVNYTLYSRNINSSVTVALTTTVLMDYSFPQCTAHNHYCLLRKPSLIKFNILPCPSGFTLKLIDNLSRCDCYPVFMETLNATCHITTKGTGFFSWTGDHWISVNGNQVIYDEYCPHDYCKKGEKLSTSQCESNRAGRLCGTCSDGYSLAIGSSNCIHCETNNNLALIIFFAAAGFLLVFFIGTLNVTVTQGTINGLIFYANIVWNYKDIFFTPEGSNIAVMIFLKTFIAWLNLDFGIEICFVKGLTAFWKTWLQFVFPFYIWIIAGLIIIATRHSIRLTNLLGNRAVPLLATLFLISYMKLLRIAVSTLEFSILSRVEYTSANLKESSSQLVIWSVDGSLAYFEFPHVLLFMAGLVTLVFLWMPYTMLLFLMQWLRRLPQRGLLKYIMRFNPLYDAYFAPLKHKYHYWFGALLLARGILLVTFASSFAIPQDINLLLLLLLGMFLVYYMVLTRPYKSTGILILQSSYLMNLTVLSGFFFFAYRQPNGSTLQSVAIGLSTGLVFLQFCGTVIHAVIIVSCCCKGSSYSSELNIHTASARGYRDSILNESDTEPLLPTY